MWLTLEQKGRRDLRSLLQPRFSPRIYRLLGPEDNGRRTRAYTRATNGQEVRQKTFDTLELLQSILIHLLARQLYGVQRVSHQFRHAIFDSRPIRLLCSWNVVSVSGRPGSLLQEDTKAFTSKASDIGCIWVSATLRVKCTEYSRHPNLVLPL